MVILISRDAYSNESGGRSFNAWNGNANSSNANVNNNNAYNSRIALRPVVFLKSDITLSGS